MSPRDLAYDKAYHSMWYLMDAMSLRIDPSDADLRVWMSQLDVIKGELGEGLR
jgi:hypothetical protein